MQIGDAITAIEEGHSLGEVIANALYSPIGILFDSRWRPKGLRMRYLRVDIGMLRSCSFNPNNIPVAQVRLVDPNPNNVPIARATIVS